MKNYHSFIPPHGTTITRVMTREERRHVGRISYAKACADELRRLSLMLGDKPSITASSFGRKVALQFNKDNVLVEFHSKRGGFSPSPMRLQYTAECEGCNAFANWLAYQDPIFAARLIKNAHKKILDRKAYEGTQRARRERYFIVYHQRQHILESL